MKKALSKFPIDMLFIYCSLIACLFNSLNIQLWKLPVNPFLYLSVFAGFLLLTKKLTGKELSCNYDSYILFAYIAILIVSALLSEYGTDKNTITILLINFLLLICLYTIKSRFEYEKIYFIIVIFSTAVNTISLVLGIMGIDFAYYGDKLTGLYDNPNLGSQVTLISVLILIYYFINKKLNQKVCVLLITIQFIFLYFNASRNSVMALILLFLVYLLKKANKKIVISIIAGIFFCFALIIGNHEKLISESLKFNQYTETEVMLNKLSTERYAIWKESMYIIDHNKLLGCGVGNLQEAALKELGADSRIVVRKIHAAHNVLIQAFLDAGLPGGILLIAYLLVLFNKIFLILKEHKLFSAAGFTCTLILASFFFSLLDIGMMNHYLITSFIFWSHSSGVMNKAAAELKVNHKED